MNIMNDFWSAISFSVVLLCVVSIITMWFMLFVLDGVNKKLTEIRKDIAKLRDELHLTKPAKAKAVPTAENKYGVRPNR